MFPEDVLLEFPSPGGMCLLDTELNPLVAHTKWCWFDETRVCRNTEGKYPNMMSLGKRRLRWFPIWDHVGVNISQHSRPKAAIHHGGIMFWA